MSESRLYLLFAKHHTNPPAILFSNFGRDNVSARPCNRGLFGKMEPRIWGSVCHLFIFLTWIGGNAQNINCTDGTAEWIANGRCDSINNNDLCDYDGGDCCHCDCVDGADYSCGDDGFSCIDPTSECINPSAAYPNCSQYWTVGDGACEFNNNNEV